MKIVKNDCIPLEPLPEVANIIQCIVDYPLEGDAIRRSEYFKVIQKHAKRALDHWGVAPVMQ
jgi:hypothetical protein